MTAPAGESSAVSAKAEPGTGVARRRPCPRSLVQAGCTWSPSSPPARTSERRRAQRHCSARPAPPPSPRRSRVAAGVVIPVSEALHVPRQADGRPHTRPDHLGETRGATPEPCTRFPSRFCPVFKTGDVKRPPDRSRSRGPEAGFACFRTSRWARTVSNRRHPPCKGGALPLSYAPGTSGQPTLPQAVPRKPVRPPRRPRAHRARRELIGPCVRPSPVGECDTGAGRTGRNSTGEG